MWTSGLLEELRSCPEGRLRLRPGQTRLSGAAGPRLPSVSSCGRALPTVLAAHAPSGELAGGWFLGSRVSQSLGPQMGSDRTDPWPC